jgi:hypothetical protein
MATKTFRGPGYRLTMPNYAMLINRAIVSFLPEAGKFLVGKMRDKIGQPQPGVWDKLATHTKERKARSMRGPMGRTRRQTRMGWGTETPLLDTGQMRNSVGFSVIGQTVEVTADFPMGQHEQDALISPFAIAAGNPLPRRAVMGPALDESLAPLADRLELVVTNILS